MPESSDGRNQDDASDVSWRAISKDNVTTWYGKGPESRISDPIRADPHLQLADLRSHDDKGNVMAYAYKPEDSTGVDVTAAHERNRTDSPAPRSVTSNAFDTETAHRIS